MFCSSCGAQNDDGNQFCQNCGAKLIRVTADTQTPPPAQGAPDSEGANRATWALVTRIAAFVLAACYAIGIIVNIVNIFRNIYLVRYFPLWFILFLIMSILAIVGRLVFAGSLAVFGLRYRPCENTEDLLLSVAACAVARWALCIVNWILGIFTAAVSLGTVLSAILGIGSVIGCLILVAVFTAVCYFGAYLSEGVFAFKGARPADLIARLPQVPRILLDALTRK